MTLPIHSGRKSHGLLVPARRDRWSGAESRTWTCRWNPHTPLNIKIEVPPAEISSLRNYVLDFSCNFPVRAYIDDIHYFSEGICELHLVFYHRVTVLEALECSSGTEHHLIITPNPLFLMNLPEQYSKVQSHHCEYRERRAICLRTTSTSSFNLWYSWAAYVLGRETIFLKSSAARLRMYDFKDRSWQFRVKTK